MDQQQEWDAAAHAEGKFAMLKGLNLKRFAIGAWPKVSVFQTPSESARLSLADPPAIRWAQHLF